MTLRVGKLVYGLLKLLPCLLAVLLASSCSSDPYSDEMKGGETLVTLTVATGNGRTIPSRATSDGAGSVTTGVASSTDKDNYITDLLVYIFDKNGNVIGTDQGNYTVTDASTITVKVKTRPAEGCTVYAIANAATLTEKAFPFAGVSTLAELKSQVMSFSKVADDGLVEQEKSTCLLMVGCLTGFNTTTTANTNITLQRLASKITFNIKAEANNINGISYPVVIDSYQLCNVPNATFYTYDDMANPKLPADNTYQNFSEQNKTQVKSWENPTVSYVQYVYANPATAETNATYLLIKAHAQASSANTSKIWESVFKVYLKEVKQGGALMTTQYQILPNYHYTVNITIKGSKVTTDNGVECTAYPFFSSSNPDKNLDDWIDGQEKIDFDYEEK